MGAFTLKFIEEGDVYMNVTWVNGGIQELESLKYL
jgi:hypothetical protein